MYRQPLMPQSQEMWRFPAVGAPPSQAMGLLAGRIGGVASVDGSTVTEQSWGSKGSRPRRGGPDEESSKLDSTSSGDGRNYSGSNCGFCNILAGQNPQAMETPKRDFIHVRARRGQATDSHSLAERARREKISERMKILQDLVPGCDKVIGKASVLDEIINYIQALQNQIEFLSMKLEAVNAPLSTSIKGFPPRDICGLAYDATSGLAFNSQATREYEQDPGTRWLQMQVGSDFGRVATMARDDSTMDNKSMYRQIS